jgi:diguanylate cyclase (GGDEF)-like protein/PAS domain S-box-containing protein
MIVLTRSQDHVEVINSTLRNAGHAVHCSWIRDLHDLTDALGQINAEMLIAVIGDDPAELSTIMHVRDQCAPEVPVIIAADKVDEDSIARAMQHGARDMVTLGHRQRLQAVVSRELRAFRLERALNSTLTSARESREQLKAFMAGSADAIAQVQEGIVVDVNPAWLELFGHQDADAMNGQPLMDTFDQQAQSALKGALVACLQGKWTDHSLKVNGLLSDGSAVALELELSRGEFDGEPAVRVCVPARKRDVQALDQQLTEAIERDGATGMLQRRYFMEHLHAALARPIKGGVRQMLYIEPDRYTKIIEDLGTLAADEFMSQLAAVLREQLHPQDIVGRFGEGSFIALIERGTPRDVEAWAGGVLRKIKEHVFKINGKSISCTCSVGIGLMGARVTDPAAPIKDAIQARQSALEQGGDRVYVIDHTDDDTKQEASDKIWVRLIKSALMENRFRLMQQPIASLLGEEKSMFDILVRMIDEGGQEVLPSEFIAAAERNDLMKNIDRWVVGASMSLCANRPIERLFVRLSRDSVVDRSLPVWLSNQLKATRIDPERIVLQVSEAVATTQLLETAEFAKAMRAAGFRFAVEHFGAGRDSLQLLAQVPLDYIKIDGTLMQGLATDRGLQQRVKVLVDGAKAKNIATIAERVEDANTMAVLWQLGIEFLQGYFVNEPEQVVLG